MKSCGFDGSSDERAQSESSSGLSAEQIIVHDRGLQRVSLNQGLSDCSIQSVSRTSRAEVGKVRQ